jgi:hypothetical protein
LRLVVVFNWTFGVDVISLECFKLKLPEGLGHCLERSEGKVPWAWGLRGDGPNRWTLR